MRPGSWRKGGWRWCPPSIAALRLPQEALAPATVPGVGKPHARAFFSTWASGLGEPWKGKARGDSRMMSFLEGAEMRAGPRSGRDQQCSASHRGLVLCWGIFPSAGSINGPGLGGSWWPPLPAQFPMKLTAEAPGLKKGSIQIETLFFCFSFLPEVFCHCPFDTSLSERLRPPLLASPPSVLCSRSPKSKPWTVSECRPPALCRGT